MEMAFKNITFIDCFFIYCSFWSTQIWVKQTPPWKFRFQLNSIPIKMIEQVLIDLPTSSSNMTNDRNLWYLNAPCFELRDRRGGCHFSHVSCDPFYEPLKNFRFEKHNVASKPFFFFLSPLLPVYRVLSFFNLLLLSHSLFFRSLFYSLGC